MENCEAVEDSGPADRPKGTFAYGEMLDHQKHVRDEQLYECVRQGMAIAAGVFIVVYTVMVAIYGVDPFPSGDIDLARFSEDGSLILTRAEEFWMDLFTSFFTMYLIMATICIGIGWRPLRSRNASAIVLVFPCLFVAYLSASVAPMGYIDSIFVGFLTFIVTWRVQNPRLPATEGAGTLLVSQRSGYSYITLLVFTIAACGAFKFIVSRLVVATYDMGVG